MGFRAPAVAPELFGASGAVAGWALIASGGLGLCGLVGLRPHRRGLLLLAGALLVLPLATAHVTNADLVVPCVIAGAVLSRVGLVRWPGLGEPSPAPATAGPRTPGAAALPGAPGGARPPSRPVGARLAGRLAGRASTVLGREVSVSLPRAARAAGRAAGRARQHPPQG